MQRGNAVAQAVIGALALLAPGIAPAQIDSPSVPSMLATALLSGTRSAGIMNEARYVVGTLPAGWPIGISPAAPATVVGGMINGHHLIVVFADTTRRFLERYFTLLEQNGWKSHTLPASTIESSGFQSTGWSNDGLFCRDSAGVTALPVAGAATGALVHVMYRASDARCFPPAPRVVARLVDEPLKFPVLKPPKSSRFPSFGGSSSAGDVSTRVRLIDSTLGSAAIVAHYAKQLVEAGWTAGTFQESYTDLFASQAFDACDTTGRHWTGTLSVVSTRANRDVSITMWLDERP